MPPRRRARKEPETSAYVVLNDDVDPIELAEGQFALRASLSRRTQLAADVVIDLQSKGALFGFLKQTYRDAIEALEALVEVNPSDAKAVYALQRRIHPYFDACRFIKESLARGEEADATIEETFGHGPQYPD